MTEEQIAAETEGKKLRTFIESRSTLRAWWEGLPEEEKVRLEPFAKRIAALPDDEMKRIVKSLPDEIAPPATRRFLTRCLGYQVNVLREEVE